MTELITRLTMTFFRSTKAIKFYEEPYRETKKFGEKTERGDKSNITDFSTIKIVCIH